MVLKADFSFRSPQHYISSRNAGPPFSHYIKSLGNAWGLIHANHAGAARYNLVKEFPKMVTVWSIEVLHYH